MTDLAKKTVADIAPQTASASPSDRFMQAVLRNFQDNSGELKVTNYQKKLLQSYFIKLDSVLRVNETKRLAQDEAKRTKIPFTWPNVNMTALSQDAVAYAAIGLDPLQKNHVSLICYGNSKTGQLDIGFLIGYVGLELKAKKYGFDVPDDVVIHVVYKNDKFESFRKDKDNPIENYSFKVPDEFDRGEIKGGFYYFIWHDKPEKNKLRTFSIAQILKRRPDKASVEFWGGTKTKKVKVWEDNPTPGQEGKRWQVEQTIEEHAEGWYDEMVFKTLARAAYDSIAIDSEKIDDHLVAVMQTEERVYENKNNTENVKETIKNEVDEKGNKENFSFEEAQVIDDQQSGDDGSENEISGDEEQQVDNHPEEPPVNVMAQAGQEIAKKEEALLKDVPDKIALKDQRPPKKSASIDMEPGFGDGLFDEQK